MSKIGKIKGSSHTLSKTADENTLFGFYENGSAQS